VNVKEYISSGIVESYVMGLVTDAERQEFESLSEQHPEIVAARNAFELALEEQLLGDAKQAPQHLRKLVEEKLSTSASETTAVELEEEEIPVRRIGVWKWIAAASVILMAGAIYWAVSTNNKYQQAQTENKELQEQLNLANGKVKEMQPIVEDADKLSHGMKMAVVKGTTNPAMYATVYWDTTTKDVYLMINNMPEPASDKQYQLWALLKGQQPINLGSLEVTRKRLLYGMKNVQNAQAFAISIEPKGSNPDAPSAPPVAMSKL
jgi:anti-sigma-K factor RskA